jgi:hypothetical protein
MNRRHEDANRPARTRTHAHTHTHTLATEDMYSSRSAPLLHLRTNSILKLRPPPAPPRQPSPSPTPQPPVLLPALTSAPASWACARASTCPLGVAVWLGGTGALPVALQVALGVASQVALRVTRALRLVGPKKGGRSFAARRAAACGDA